LRKFATLARSRALRGFGLGVDALLAHAREGSGSAVFELRESHPQFRRPQQHRCVELLGADHEGIRRDKEVRGLAQLAPVNEKRASPSRPSSRSIRARVFIAPGTAYALPGSRMNRARARRRGGFTMNEPQLRRLFRRLALLSAPLPLAVLGAACGGSAIVDSSGGGGSSATGGEDIASAGAAANGGSGYAGATRGGGGGAVDVTAGASGVAGASACIGMVAPCGSGPVTVPKTCIDPSLAVATTQLPRETCNQLCDTDRVTDCAVSTVDATSITVQCSTACFTGRRPAGLSEPLAAEGCELGGFFAEVARLEAASVCAFRILRDELRAHGAPKKLVRAAARAARDEIRHTRATSALARRFGSKARPATIEPRPLRSVEAMAVENAAEGCVRETYGALLATRQAARARDPVVRAAMMRIARDETRHASLSWRVDRWLETRLDPEAKRNVERAKRTAAGELLRSAAEDGSLSYAGDLGLPGPAEARLLIAEMTQAIWS
jgi:hypothetical protein